MVKTGQGLSQAVAVKRWPESCPSLFLLPPRTSPHIPPSMSSGPTQLELLEEATSGFDALLNNDLPTANRILSSQSESPFHLLGLGLTAFLAAALGQEDTELFGALAILSKAEAAATLGISKRGKGEPTTVYPAGTEYRVSPRATYPAAYMLGLICERPGLDRGRRRLSGPCTCSD